MDETRLQWGQRLQPHHDWFDLKEEMHRAAIWERVMRLNKRRTVLQEIQQPLDWQPWQRHVVLTRECHGPSDLARPFSPSLRTTKEDSIRDVHIVDNRPQQFICFGCARKPTRRVLHLQPKTFFLELEQGINLEFWAQRLLQQQTYDISTSWVLDNTR